MRSEYNAVFVPLGGGESAVAMWMTSVTTMSNDDYTSNRRGNSEREIKKKDQPTGMPTAVARF